MGIEKLVNIHFEITDKCNFYCNYCYRFDTEKIRESEDVSDSKVIELAEKLIEVGLPSVTLTGGEPLIRKKLLLELVKMFREHNINVSINTNFQFADEELLKRLLELGQRNFLISCPSTDTKMYKKITGGGDLEKLKKNLKLVTELGFNTMVNMVVTKENINQIFETAKDLRELGISRFTATPMSFSQENQRRGLFLSIDEIKKCVTDLIRVNNELHLDIDCLEPLPICAMPTEAFFKDYKFLQRTCGAGRTTLGISSTGEVRPCPLVIQSYGNLFDDSLSEIYDRMENWRNGTYLPSECKECKVLHKCNGSCRVNAKSYSGRWNDKGPWFVNKFEYNIFKDLDQNRPSQTDKKCINGKSTFKENDINSSISFSKDSLVYFESIFDSKKINKDKYVIMLSSNVFTVNKKMYKLILKLKKVLPLKLEELIKIFKVYSNDDAILKEINYLYKNKVIYVMENSLDNISKKEIC